MTVCCYGKQTQKHSRAYTTADLYARVCAYVRIHVCVRRCLHQLHHLHHSPCFLNTPQHNSHLFLKFIFFLRFFILQCTPLIKNKYVSLPRFRTGSNERTNKSHANTDLASCRECGKRQGGMCFSVSLFSSRTNRYITKYQLHICFSRF